MTQRPHVDQPQLEQMLRLAAAAGVCPRCPAHTRRTSRRTAENRLEVRCAGCGAELAVAAEQSPEPPRDLP